MRRRFDFLSIIAFALLGYLLGRHRAKAILGVDSPTKAGAASEVASSHDHSPVGLGEGFAPPTPASHPQPIGFIRRYGITELATIIGIPLALIGLFLNFIATRDTSRELASSNRQLQLAEQLAQPTLRLKTHISSPALLRSEERYDRLALEVDGTTPEISAVVLPVFLLRDAKGDTSITSALNWWRSVGPEQGEAERWIAKPSLLVRGSNENRSKDDVLLLSTVEATYTDVFGKEHRKYLAAVEQISGFEEFRPSGTYRLRKESTAEKCAEQLVTHMQLTVVARSFSYTMPWQKTRREATGPTIEERIRAGRNFTVADVRRLSSYTGGIDIRPCFDAWLTRDG